MYKPKRSRTRRRSKKPGNPEKEFPSLMDKKQTVEKSPAWDNRFGGEERPSNFAWRTEHTEHTENIKKDNIYEKAKIGFILFNSYPVFPESPTVPLFN